MNIYTMLLIIAFIFLVTSCVLLHIELKRWGSYPWWNTSEASVPGLSAVLPGFGPSTPWRTVV